ncbi:Allantoinase [Savitreella phatthalungensis]
MAVLTRSYARGRTDWEGFETGSRAAISGGVTTLVDMPLNAIPPTTTIENFDIKRAAAIGKCHTDMAFWGGVIPGNQDSLKPLVKAGVRGFKCFTIESGVDEFPCVGPEDIDLAMDELDGTGSILMFHAEVDAGGCGPTHESHTESDPDLYKTFLESRPQSFEVDAITQIIAMAKRHPGLRLHIVHLAAAQALPILEAAQAAGVAITAETCFHYLTFDSGEIPSRATQYKCKSRWTISTIPR